MRLQPRIEEQFGIKSQMAFDNALHKALYCLERNKSEDAEPLLQFVQAEPEMLPLIRHPYPFTNQHSAHKYPMMELCQGTCTAQARLLKNKDYATRVL